MPTWDANILPRLPQHLVPQFGHWLKLLKDEKRVVKEALLAVGSRNRSAFLDALGRLNSNPATEVMALALLRVHASGGGTIHRPMNPLEGESEDVIAAVESGFVALDIALQHDAGEQIVRHGYLNSPRPTRYEYNELPTGWSVETFINTWDDYPGARLDGNADVLPPKQPLVPTKGVTMQSQQGSRL